MCGICGFSGDKAKLMGQHVLKEMLDIMYHRGPDDEGIYYGDSTGLGMRRLSIIDIKSGHQPVHNEQKNIWVIFNGEIYNYQRLRKYLVAKGHKFYTQSDTEVIVHLYEEYGENFVSYLDGMFAIAIYDEKNKKILLIRDRLGIKPLYYTIADNTIIFASEIKSLIKCPIIETNLNYDKLAVYLTYRYVPGEQTMFKNILKLMPGHILTYSNNKINIKKYWDIDFKNQIEEKPEFYYKEKISYLFENSIKNRLISDVPLGIFISGGLDSSIILSKASKLYEGKLKTFSIAFKEPKENTNINEFNELKYAKETAKFYGSDHHELTVNPEDVIEDIEKIIWHMDEPLSDPTAIPLYYVSKLAKNYVKVVLSGEGADEIFAGYTVYKEPNVISKYNILPKFIREKFIEPLVLAMPFNFGKNFIQRSKLPINKRYKGVGMTFKENELPLILNRDIYSSLIDIKNDPYISSIYMLDWKDEVSQMLYFDQKIWLSEDVLLKSDKMSMAHSIELRVPFLDYKLVQFAASIPSKLKYKGNIEKYILKQTFKNDLPYFVLNRKKNGFPVPITSLVKNEYKNFARDILLSQKALNRGYFNKSYIEGLLSGKYKGTHTGRQIWLLLVFELWHRMFIDSINNDFEKNQIFIA
ncbi:asparagine synthase [Thermoanaerobacter sp. YS13]|uniref:asparagine synthase (glutamine-hydrolyzing) n=1 Tax=Thermoanaerobacter sp. YS13 TaxID=1511746 RepID=UPI0005742CBF|nr:asparagine synthase (glutamine-hydrolyzing) [Thermoanaerobacter sp. YS13]KHO61749.1 asparagine synthase [Thermoanaerobacter sp. YS13]